MVQPEVVILFEIPPTTRDSIRYTRTTKEDLEIFFWDLSEFLNSERSSIYSDHSVLSNEIKCNRLSKFVQLLREQGRNTIYISRLGNSFRATLLHLIIKVFNGVIVKSPQSWVPLKPRLHDSFVKITVKAARDQFICLVESCFVDYAVITSREAEKNSSVKKKIYSHQFDYDASLSHNLVSESRELKPFVFLDEFVPFHPDNIGRQVSDCEPNKYYESLNKIFGQFETNFKTSIVIAAHPRAEYKDNPFDGREIVFGNTAELVSNSAAVMIHASTAVSFAILNSKPIISLISSLYSEYYKSSILDMSLSTGSYLYDIDCKENLHEIPVVDKVAYKNYREQYIRHPMAGKHYWMDEVLASLGYLC